VAVDYQGELRGPCGYDEAQYERDIRPTGELLGV